MTFEDELRIALSVNPYDVPGFMEQVQAKIEREEAIVKIMMVFPTFTYGAYPTPEQVEQLLERVEQAKLTNAEALYHLFVNGTIPPQVDAIIKELAVGWRPAGKIVEADETP